MSFYKAVNNYLRSYRDMHMLLDAWIVIEAAEIEFVYRWREQAEEAMRASGRPAMTPDQVSSSLVL